MLVRAVEPLEGFGYHGPEKAASGKNPPQEAVVRFTQAMGITTGTAGLDLMDTTITMRIAASTLDDSIIIGPRIAWICGERCTPSL